MSRSALAVARVATWALAVFLASFASKGLLDLAPATGSTSLVLLVGSLLVFGFVAACVVTGIESLFPRLRRP